MSQSTPAFPDVRRADAGYKPFPTFVEWSHGLTIDTVRLERYKAGLAALRASSSPTLLKRSLDVVKRAAAIDTGAIEGLYETDRSFTFTVATEAAYWQAALEDRGPHVRALFESQLGAYDFVLDLATERAPVAEAWVRTLHERLCAPQDTYTAWTEIGLQEQQLPKGQYKHLPNHVRLADGTIHSYAPADLTPAEMHRLCEELRSEAFANAHPALQAAYAHYAFVVIHPFSDGNGRVARALASIYTLREYSIPLLVMSDQRKDYLSALESADRGRPQAFVDFIVDRILDGLRLAEESLRDATLPPLEDILGALKELYVTRGGYTHEQVDDAGRALIEVFERELTRQATQASAEGAVRVNIGRGRPSPPSDTTHRPLGIGQVHEGVMIQASTNPPVDATLTHAFVVQVPKDAGAEDDIRILGLAGGEQFEARVDELIPLPAVALQMRLTMFADRVVKAALEALRVQAARRINR